MKTALSASLLAATALVSFPMTAFAASVDAFTSLPMADVTDPETLNSRCDAVIAEGERRMAELEAMKGPSTVDTALQSYDDLLNVLSSAGGDFSLYENVFTTPDLRKAGADCGVRLSALGTKIGLSRPIYEALKAIDTTDLDDETRYYLDEKIAEYERSGVALDDEKRAKVQALQERIAQLGTDFSANIANATGSIKVLPSELDGLPRDFIDAHPAGPDGLVTITTRYPDITPVRSYANSDKLRERLMRVYYSRAYPENAEILKEIFDTRNELALLLGRPNFASLALENKMLTTPEKVAEQIDQLANAAMPAAKADLAKQTAMLQELRPGAELTVFNSSWVGQHVKKAEYDLDPQEVRQYFTYDNVRAGVFQLVEDLFQVEIRPWDTPVWDPDVVAFEVVDSGKVLGRFYLDSHPRDGKYSHAAHLTLRRGVAGGQPALSMLMMNLPKGGYDTGLMEHGDVETFLHEFGHLVHNMLGGGHRWYAQNGVATERDFVEAPSQMLENWVYDYETLSRFAKNESGEVIPRSLVEKMNKARYFGQGMFERGQAGYSNASLKFHLGPAPEADAMSATFRDYANEFSVVPWPEGTNMFASFGHLYGYSTVYYTYGWSRVIGADLFTRFEKAGLRDAKTAMDYRRYVLGAGGTKPAAKLVEDFLGRPVKFDAYQKTLLAGQ